ncbi:ABC transporter ATP-binding protein [Schlesneria sp. T3-172]|uniref:ABC transporter ATP-binding protein n=1 Tax=Schlesneria sphaerica TaxID=3373610 RepID=UPI0037C9ACB9
MTLDLVANFSLQYHKGPRLDIEFTQSTQGFSVTSLIGPSGCGKTTFLRCLAGLHHPDHGAIQFGDQIWFDRSRRVALSPQQRDVGFLFQEYALFPHLNIADNIGFGLKQSSSRERRRRIHEIMAQLDLAGLEQRFPHQLSGGQQQRVALGRILARRPRLLLLDEPLSALDALLRERLRAELRQILQEFGVPTIIVTHDRVEAMALADRVAVMDQGRIQQVGTVEDVFSRPSNARLALLVGVETVVSGEIIANDQGLATVQVGQTLLLAVAPSAATRMVHVCIKGEDVALQKGTPGTTTIRNQLRATIRSLTPEGPLIRVGLECGFEMTALITRPAQDDLKLQVGDDVTAMVKAPAIHLIPRSG